MLKPSSIFLLLFIILGPIKTIVPFVQLTAGSEPATVRSAALKATHNLRMDNGPVFIAHGLQEWCTDSGTGTAYIPPGSPWENPFVESYELRSTSSTTAD